MDRVCKFTFRDGINKMMIEEQIVTAIISAECTFGSARVRIHASYAVSDSKAVIDVSSDVGEHIAQVFTGLMIRKIGEESFTVDRITKK